VRCWGDIEPRPLRRPCASCGGAFVYLNHHTLCDSCELVFQAEMADVEQYWQQQDKADEDRAAVRVYYGP
jgi:predicted amidophosphoribosyltransferase